MILQLVMPYIHKMMALFGRRLAYSKQVTSHSTYIKVMVGKSKTLKFPATISTLKQRCVRHQRLINVETRLHLKLWATLKM